MGKRTEIVEFGKKAKEIWYKEPENNYLSSERHGNSIKNAWQDGTIIDKETGGLWISEDKLNIILRTNKKNAKYFVGQLNKNDKRNYKGKVYVKGTPILSQIDLNLQSTDTIIRENYLKYSFDNYAAIRDSDAVKIIRAAYKERLKQIKKELKKQRIKVFEKQGIKIVNDELTGNTLKKGAEFSHICSCSMHPEKSTSIYNGLIVNKSTHKIITDEGINDEEELLDLCNRMGWKTGWYNGFKAFID